MHLGLFGGSFDPPHVGHLLLAQDALEQLALDELRVVPAATQPLKQGAGASAELRLAMVRAAFAGIPRVVVDPIEIDRRGLSFTVDTVAAFRERWPAARLSLLLGEDSVATLPQWQDPARLLSLAQLVIVTRAGSGVPDAPGAADVAVSGAGSAPSPWAMWPEILPPRRLSVRRVDVSATEIRSRVARGLSLKGFVPDAVADLVASAGVYQSRTSC